MTRKLKYIPIVGEKYRDWEVISNKIFKKNTNRATYWKVRCKCGKEAIRDASHLVNNKVSSCKSCAALSLSFEKSYYNKIKRRAEKAGFEFNISFEYFLSIFNKKCSISGEDIHFGKHWTKLSEQTASLDRIDNSKGYVVGNIQWVHKDINFMKGKLTLHRFLELCHKINNNNSKCG